MKESITLCLNYFLHPLNFITYFECLCPLIVSLNSCTRDESSDDGGGGAVGGKGDNCK